MEDPNSLDSDGSQRDVGFPVDTGKKLAVAVGALERTWPLLQAGPLATVAEDLIGWLTEQGYASTTQVNLSRAAVRLGAWMLAENLELGELDRGRVMVMVREDNEHCPGHRSANQNVSAVLRFLIEKDHLKPTEVTEADPRPVQVCLVAWLKFLQVEQGQGVSWIYKARRVAEPFLTLLEQPSGELAWERVDVRMANEFLQNAVAGYSSSTAQCTAALLRGLLSWAATNGWVKYRVALGVLSPRRIRAGLPKGLTPGEVAALKDAVDFDSATGRRDMAVIVMLARLGVRIGEVAALTLEDLNWSEPSLRMVGKGGRVLILPMPVDVGETLVDYLRIRHAGPGERGVFIRSLPPFTALNRGGIGEIVFKHARIAGLHGMYPHRLRHTAATKILAEGGNLRQVQELLGHASVSSSVTYARVDMVPLRPLAPSWGKLP